MRLGRFTRQADPAAYERTELGTDYVEHLDGVDWFYADVPPRWHRCWPQTRGWVSVYRELVERCACGSLRFDGHGPWVDRNSRKRETAEERAARDRDRELQRLIRAFEVAEEARDGHAMNELIIELRQLG